MPKGKPNPLHLPLSKRQKRIVVEADGIRLEADRDKFFDGTITTDPVYGDTLTIHSRALAQECKRLLAEAKR